MEIIIFQYQPNIEYMEIIYIYIYIYIYILTITLTSRGWLALCVVFGRSSRSEAPDTRLKKVKTH